MRMLLVLAAVLFATPAFALDRGIIEGCMMTKDPTTCIEHFSNQEQAYNERSRELDAQIEMNRQQAAGMALFGSGPALINGMNQGFQNMQVKPYMNPMPSR